MKKHFLHIVIFLVSIFFIATSCKKTDPVTEPLENDTTEDKPTPYDITQDIPSWFPPMAIPADNPMTVEGIDLGRKLFYDPILSGDSTQACASCHNIQMAFTDNGKQFSTGIDGSVGTRNAMALMNLGWANFGFFWDGSALTLEDQALIPVTNPVEMKNTWENAIAALQAHSEYPKLFKKAFGTDQITKELVAKAMAQFERTLISGNSKFDKAFFGGNISLLTAEEINGFQLFLGESDPANGIIGGDCFHCHGSDGNPLFTIHSFANNGLDAVSGYYDFIDLGRGAITGDSLDNGKFKVPTLRNIALTAPYMHDGRFSTLADVINNYDANPKQSPNLDPNIAKHAPLGLKLSTQQKNDIIAFLHTLTDTAFVNNPKFKNPFTQ